MGVVHDAAARGFDRNAATYERSRPTYPDEAVALLGDLGARPGARVIDLAAGTGKLTRLLVATGADVTAIEPVAGMRAELAAAVPGVEVLEGTAEAMPVPDRSVDMVTVAQAFHWFDAAAALAEIHRVLQPGGVLAIVYNQRDETVPWVQSFTAILDARRGDVPTAWSYYWRRPFETTDLFEPLEQLTFATEQPYDADLLVERARSVSFVATLAGAERDALVAEVRALAAELPDLFTMPHLTHVHWCHRRR